MKFTFLEHFIFTLIKIRNLKIYLNKKMHKFLKVGKKKVFQIGETFLWLIIRKSFFLWNRFLFWEIFWKQIYNSEKFANPKVWFNWISIFDFRKFGISNLENSNVTNFRISKIVLFTFFSRSIIDNQCICRKRKREIKLLPVTRTPWGMSFSDKTYSTS